MPRRTVRLCLACFPCRAVRVHLPCRVFARREPCGGAASDVADGGERRALCAAGHAAAGGAGVDGLGRTGVGRALQEVGDRRGSHACGAGMQLLATQTCTCGRRAQSHTSFVWTSTSAASCVHGGTRAAVWLRGRGRVKSGNVTPCVSTLLHLTPLIRAPAMSRQGKEEDLAAEVRGLHMVLERTRAAAVRTGRDAKDRLMQQYDTFKKRSVAVSANAERPV
eukprot:357581-Chlamydomonas_euryale.AAC.6